MELRGGGERRWWWHAAAAVRSGKTVYVIEFGGVNSSIRLVGGVNSSDTKVAATTILQMCKYMVGGEGGGGGNVGMSVFLPFLSPSSTPYEY